jgi:hypothetical protein
MIPWAREKGLFEERNLYPQWLLDASRVSSPLIIIHNSSFIFTAGAKRGCDENTCVKYGILRQAETKHTIQASNYFVHLL